MILVAIAFSSSGLIPVSLLAICTKISASEVTCSSVSFASATVEELEAVSLEAVSEVDETVSLVDDDELVLV
ncbi:TPA: hypothetical protein U2B44_000435 [Streptococcus suis]|nr:hypothetical protein [Streptococcus suis]